MKFRRMKFRFMKFGFNLPLRLAAMLLAAMPLAAIAQTGVLNVPRTVEAGSAFSIPTTGSGKAVLYIVGPEQVLRREVQADFR